MRTYLIEKCGIVIKEGENQKRKNKKEEVKSNWKND